MTAADLMIRWAPLAEILPLRHAILRPGRPLTAAAFDGDDDVTTRHLGAFLGGACGCCLTLMRRPWRGEPAWQLRGMATRSELQRRGVGAALVRVVEAALRLEDDTRLLWCKARVTAVPFYERLGWRVTSDLFDIPDVGPHREMTRRV